MTYLFTAVEEKYKFDVRFALHDGVPPLKVVLVAGETVDEEAVLCLIFSHGLLHCLQEREEYTYIFQP